MAELNDWDIAAANNNDTPPDGWPENTMQYSEVNNTGREGMSVLARYYQDTNGTLSTAGVADAYTLTTNGAYTSYFAGLRLVATFHATNTTASVIDVNLIGTTSIVDRAGNPLVGNELTAGGIYELLHDGTQFQLMGTPGGAVSSESGVFTNSDAPDLVDTNVALVVGALDPDTSTHVEMGPQQIQAKTNATTPAILNLNALGGDVRAGAQSGTGGVVLFDDGLERAATAGGGNFTVFADDSLDPSTVTLSLSGQGGSPARSLHGYLGSIDLQTTNLLQGGRQIIKATKTGGGTVDTIIADPDGPVELHHNGVKRISTDTSGAIDVFSDTSTDTEDRMLVFRHADDTSRGFVGHQGSSVLKLQNAVHGGLVQLRAENAVGATVNLFEGDPDDDTALFDTGAKVARTLPAAGGGFQVNNTLTGGGFERALTTSDISTTKFYEKQNGTLTIVNDAVVSPVAQMTMDITETGVYLVQGLMAVTAVSGTPDLKIIFVSPNTGVMDTSEDHLFYSVSRLNAADWSAEGLDTAAISSRNIVISSGASSNGVVVHFVAHANVTGIGTFDIEISQVTSSPDSIALQDGSFWTWMRIN